MKKCKDCGEDKELNDIQVHSVNSAGKISYRSYCKPCWKISQRIRLKKYDVQYDITEIIVKTKVCQGECKKEKPAGEFYKNRREKDGLQKKCIECKREYSQKPDIKLKTAQYKKEYAIINEQDLKVKSRERKKNRKEIDPAYRLRELVSVSIYQALFKKDAKKNGESVWKHLKYTPQDLKEYLENQFEPWMTWENHGVYKSKTWDDNDSTTWTWQLDHIIPCSDLPFENMNDVNFDKCWDLENLRPLSAKQNQYDGVNRTRHKKNKK